MARQPPRELVYRPATTSLFVLGIAILLVVAAPPLVFVPLTAGLVFGELVAFAFVFFLVSLLRRHVHVALDEARGELAIRDVRWPLRARELRVPLADFADAEVVLDPSMISGGPAARVEIVLRSGARVPITPSYWTPGEKHHDFARVLRALAKVDEAEAPRAT